MKNQSVRVRARRIGARADYLVGFLLKTYAQSLLLRPMRLNAALIARHAGPKRACFEQLRATLYWNLVLELMKLTADADRRGRTASIPVITRELRRDRELRNYLLRLYSRARLPIAKGEDREVWIRLCKAERAELRKKFWETYARLRENVNTLRRSAAFRGFKLVRNQMLAHHQVVTQSGQIRRFNLGVLKLKVGDENLILKKTCEIADDLNSITRRASFSWDSYLRSEERDVCAFWDIKSLDG